MKSREEGLSHRQIAEMFGLDSSDQVRELVRVNKRRQVKAENKLCTKSIGGCIAGSGYRKDEKGIRADSESDREPGE